MAEEIVQRVTLTLGPGYQFVASFDAIPGGAPVLMDEPEPLGEGRGPNAAALVAAGVANCLAASLLFCLRKSRTPVDGLTAHATTRIARNEAGRYRIRAIDVELAPAVAPEERARLDRCHALFENYCIVTQSIRDGIEVNVTIAPPVPVPA